MSPQLRATVAVTLVCVASVLVGACRSVQAKPLRRSIFSFDPAREPPLVHYAYSSGHFELVYEVFLYADRTVCYFDARDPRRVSPRFYAESTELGGLCSVGPDRCTWPAESLAKMAIGEALHARTDPAAKIEVHIYTHPEETGSLEESIALAEARSRTLKPLLAEQGIAADSAEFYAHGWQGAGTIASGSEPERDEPCADSLTLWAFASDAEAEAHGRDLSGFDFHVAESARADEAREAEAAFESELRDRCRAAASRCAGARCLRGFDNVGWAEVVASGTYRERRELVENGPVSPQWLAQLRAQVEDLREDGGMAGYGNHPMRISITAGGRDVGYRFFPGQLPPERARKLDTFFTRMVARGCRFDASPAETQGVLDPRQSFLH